VVSQGLYICKMIRLNDYILNRTLTIFLPIQLVLIGWASRNPEWVEKYYSSGLYPTLSGFMRRLLGWIPFSVGDVLYGILFFSILGWIWYLYETRFSPILEQTYRIGAFLSVIIFLFHLLWGMNYYRVSLQEKLGIASLQYDTIQLNRTAEKHIKRINAIHSKIVKNDSLVPKLPYSKYKVFSIASNAYKDMSYKNVDLNFKHRSVKKSLFSIPLSYMGFSGYLNPFTGESQVNRKIPITTFPITTTHEMAHQLGYASETEANYIGYLVCRQNKDLYFQYSGEFMAIKFLIYEVSKYNPDLGEKYFQSLNFGIRKNIQYNQDIWDSYKTNIKPISQKIYDHYLKANDQENGLKSYNAMVAFLIVENFE